MKKRPWLKGLKAEEPKAIHILVVGVEFKAQDAVSVADGVAVLDLDIVLVGVSEEVIEGKAVPVTVLVWLAKEVPETVLELLTKTCGLLS